MAAGNVRTRAELKMQDGSSKSRLAREKSRRDNKGFSLIRMLPIYL